MHRAGPSINRWNKVRSELRGKWENRFRCLPTRRTYHFNWRAKFPVGHQRVKMSLQSCCGRLLKVMKKNQQEGGKNGVGAAAPRPAADGSLQPPQPCWEPAQRSPESGERHRDKEVRADFFFFAPPWETRLAEGFIF